VDINDAILELNFSAQPNLSTTAPITINRYRFALSPRFAQLYRFTTDNSIVKATNTDEMLTGISPRTPLRHACQLDYGKK
jgi:hypothetical protein